MPQFKVYSCDNCTRSVTIGINSPDPVGWRTGGFVLCDQCWGTVKQMIQPTIAALSVKFERILSTAEAGLSSRVVMTLMAEALDELRRPNQPDETCKAE